MEFRSRREQPHTVMARVSGSVFLVDLSENNKCLSQSEGRTGIWGRALNIAGILVHGTSLMLIGEVCVKMFSAFVSISLPVFRRPFNQIAGYFLISMLSRGGA